MFRHTTPSVKEQMDETFLKCVEHKYLMAVDQIIQHGCGDRTYSQYGERIHQEFIVKLARNTQKRSLPFVEQLAQQRHENFAIEKAVEANVGALMSLPGGGDGQRESTAHSDLHTTSQC